MAFTLWSQDFFAKGELSPLLYSRVTLQAYYQGLKNAKNIIGLPQGSSAKRFGTEYVCNIIDAVSAETMYFKSFQYLNECVYLVVLQDLYIDVYLGPNRVAHVASPIASSELREIDHTVIQDIFRVTSGVRSPYDLIRSSDSANAITGYAADTFTVTALTLDGYWPARFSATAMPTTSPQIYANRTYFVRAVTTTTVRVFDNVEDAANNENYFTISSAGTSANLLVQNSWAFSATSFSNLPVFDFEKDYDNNEFTPSATSGFGINLTVTATGGGSFQWLARHVGGIYVGNGGIARIKSITSVTVAVVDVINQSTFLNTSPIPGAESFVGEPAWSDDHGWPRRCSSFQNRAFYANTDSLSNGLWGSVTNQFGDFDGTEPSDPEASIAWFPTSDNVNYIEFLVPYRSFTVHTNTGVYSTPLSVETAITPINFSMSLQDTHPADNVQPAGIDNQIIALSGNDAHSLLWDGFNNAYTSNIISIFNEHLIRNPVDQAPYADLLRAGSRYMFIVNEDGTLVICQTLISENVTGLTKAEFEQPLGNAYFRWVASSSDGQAWFVTEREIATKSSAYNITAYTADTLTNDTYDFSTSTPTIITFDSGTLPASSPQVETDTNYYAVGVSTNEFKLYETYADAENDENAFAFTSAGSSAVIYAYPLVANFMIEKLSFDAKVDCAGLYPLPTTAVPVPAISSVSGEDRFTGQDIKLKGDGYGFEATVVDGEVEVSAHGVATEVTELQYGFPINVQVTPLPLSLSTTGNPKASNLLESKHVRFCSFTFADTIGGTVTQGSRTFPILLTDFNNVSPGSPPTPQTGSFETSVFNSWNDFKYDNFTINHSEPFDFILTGIFYKLEV